MLNTPLNLRNQVNFPQKIKNKKIEKKVKNE